ncbi:hypothetical protein CYLTODRAFT_389929 [Cylindrobasidium torrendii FP15055 ss-10]|uniref:Uncharacterized protein n=1 Tax=Cylindrobasidium torrendii FP15055 ss-10 TaxID=1314674 RepID=A0A0D7BMG0_9AGAR|nr:hypothetical protein CYLTODRAFT_389929 [Cylindrobasidium torrendii FP15055 ss-10]
MCQQMAEGTRWTKCMHFQRHLVVAIVDCSLKTCSRSLQHPKGCRDPGCIQNFGEEIQKDVDSVDEYCFACRAAQDRARRNTSS